MNTGAEPLRLGDLRVPQLLGAFAAAVPGGFVLLDEAGRVQSLNAAARVTMNLTHDQAALGEPWSKFARANAHDPVAITLSKSSPSVDNGTEGEVDLFRGNDVVRQRVRVAAIRERGFTLGLIVVFLGEAEARGPGVRRARAVERHRWLERAIKELPTAIYMIDLEDGRLIYENDRILAFLGRPLPIGATPEQRARELMICSSVTGRPLEPHEFPSIRAARGEIVRDCPVTWITVDGPRDALVSAQAIPAGPDSGGVVLVSVFDLTPIQQSEAHLRLALAGGDVGAWHVDLTSDRVTFSPQTAQVFDHPGETADLKGLVCRRVHPNDVGRVCAKWRAALESSEDFYDDEYRVRRGDGSVRWVFARGRVQRDAGRRALSFAGVVADVTDRVRARRRLERAKVAAEAANDAKSTFLANISHELRTPLGVILGFADLAKDPVTPPDQREQALDIITRNGRVLNRLIDDLLDLAKVEAGQIAVEAIHMSVTDVVDEVVDSLGERARAKRLALDVGVDARVPRRITSDPTRLRQVLINVVGNAIKFTERGAVRLEIARGPGDLIEVRVRDSGLGLTVEQRERIFEPFAQADETTTRRFGGTGLGLALARRLARALGGDLDVEWSEPGVGSVFLFTFRGVDAGCENHLS